jgi:hypothetical protein
MASFCQLQEIVVILPFYHVYKENCRIIPSTLYLKSNSIVLYESYETLDCNTRWLGHDERSEECHSASYKTSVILLLYFWLFIPKQGYIIAASPFQH